MTDKDCIEALQYLWGMGFVDEMTTDKRHYVSILIHRVANDLGIVLEGSE